MNRISTAVQRRIMFIPIVNVANLFIWLYNARYMYRSVTTVPKTLWILISSLLPYSILYTVFSDNSPLLAEILPYIGSYFCPLIMGYHLIRYQEKLDALP